jgi:AraC-like DNA-binding protein
MTEAPSTSAITWLLRDETTQRQLAVGERFAINEEHFRGVAERIQIGDSLIVYLGTLDVLAPCAVEARGVEDREPWLAGNVAVRGHVSIVLSDGTRGVVGPDQATMFHTIDGWARVEYPPQQRLRLAGYRLRGERIAQYFDDDMPEAILGLLDPAMSRSKLLEIPTSPRMRRVASELFSEQFNGALRRAHLEGVVLQLFAIQAAFVSGGRVKVIRSGRDRASIEEARARLLADVRNPPSASELARAVGMSEKALNAGFRELFGTTVFETLRNERLEHARIALESTDLPLKEIATRIGYNQVTNFTTAFSMRYGMPPRRYVRAQTRRLHGASQPPSGHVDEERASEASSIQHRQPGLPDDT